MTNLWLEIIAPLVGFAVAVWAGTAVGNAVTKETKSRWIGWPVGVATFLVGVTLCGFLLS